MINRVLYPALIGSVILLMAATTALGDEIISQPLASEQKRAPAPMVLLPPFVEFLAMENNQPVEAPKAETDELSARIAAQFIAGFETENRPIIVADLGGAGTALGTATRESLFTAIRRGDAAGPERLALQTYLAERYPESDILIVRARFYLEYWARSGRGWQVANGVISLGADTSDKRMLIDARVFSGNGLGELWRGLAQERVTPRASEKGIGKAAAALAGEYFLNVEKKGQDHE